MSPFLPRGYYEFQYENSHLVKLRSNASHSLPDLKFHSPNGIGDLTQVAIPNACITPNRRTRPLTLTNHLDSSQHFKTLVITSPETSQKKCKCERRIISTQNRLAQREAQSALKKQLRQALDNFANCNTTSQSTIWHAFDSALSWMLETIQSRLSTTNIG